MQELVDAGVAQCTGTHARACSCAEEHRFTRVPVGRNRLSEPLVERAAMKELVALTAFALILTGCVMQRPVNEQGVDPGSRPVEKNADQDLRNNDIQQRDRSIDFDNDWDREHFRDRGNEGHENQGSLWPWPGSGLSGGRTYPGGQSWGY